MKLPMLHDICIMRDTVKCTIEFYLIFSFFFSSVLTKALMFSLYLYRLWMQWHWTVIAVASPFVLQFYQKAERVIFLKHLPCRMQRLCKRLLTFTGSKSSICCFLFVNFSNIFNIQTHSLNSLERPWLHYWFV